MVAPYQLEEWRPERLREAADAIAAHVNTLREQVQELREGGVPRSWTLESAQAARTALNAIADEISAELERLTPVPSALDDAATRITAAQQALSGAYASAQASWLQVDRVTGAVLVARSFTNTADAQYASSRISYVRNQVRTALADADAADQALTAALTPPPPPPPPTPEPTPTPTPAPTPTPGPGTGGGYPPGGGGVPSPGPGGGVPSPGPGGGEAPRFEMLPPEEQVELIIERPGDFVGGELRLRTRELLGLRMGEELEDAAQDPRYFADPVIVERWTGLLDEFGDEPVVMAAIFERLEPKGLLTVFSGLTSTLAAGGDQAELTRLAAELREGLIVASRDPGFDGEAWGRELARYATYDISEAELTALRDLYGSASTGNAAVLDYLLRGGEYDEDFMRGVVAQLDEFERANPAAAAAWVQRDAIGSPLNQLGTEPGLLPDPMSTAMGRLSEHPYAALRFFTDADDGAARAAYYLGERDWRSDGFGGIAETVLAIGTDRENLTYLPGQTQKLVDTFLSSIVANPYFSAADAGAAAGPLATLVEQYLPEVHAAIKAGATELPGPWDQLVRVIASASAAAGAGSTAETAGAQELWGEGRTVRL